MEIEEVVETSDVEERELLAVDPRYYELQWKKNFSKTTAGKSLQTPQKGVNCSAPIQDPSPQLARLSLSASPTLVRQSTPTHLNLTQSPTKPHSPNCLTIADTDSLAHVSPQSQQIYSVPTLSPDPISFLSPGRQLNTYSGFPGGDLDVFGRSSRRQDSPSNSPLSFSPNMARVTPPPSTDFAHKIVADETPLNALSQPKEDERILHFSQASSVNDTHRWPSLSPLSSVHPTQNEGRSRSLTPRHPQGTPVNSTIEQSHVQVAPIVISPDINHQARKYSLRNRSAKQLNPFLYDKRQYTWLLKGVPEAIVKDPNREHQVLRRDRYEEEEEGNENFEPDSEDDEEERLRLRQKRLEERQKTQQARIAANARLRELGIVMPSDDDEDDDLTDGAILYNNQNKFLEKRGKKRKRDHDAGKQRRPQTFPMGNDPKSPRKERSLLLEPPSKARPRPRSLFRIRSSSPAEPQQEHIHLAHPQIDVDLSLDDNTGAGDWFYDQAELPPPQGQDMQKEGDGVGVSESEKSSDVLRREKRLRRRISSVSSGSDVQVLDTQPADPQEILDTEQESTESEEDLMARAKEDKKRLKILRKVMPAIAIKKLLAGERHKEKNKTALRQRAPVKEIHERPLLPGQVRKRIVNSNSRNLKDYEIRRDPESESQSDADDQNQRREWQSDPEIIVIDGDDKQQKEEAAEVVSEEDIGERLEDSEDELDAAGIHTWLEPSPLPEDEGPFSYEPSQSLNTDSQSRPRRRADGPREGDLIDRMLQRTRRVGSHAKAKSRSKAKEKRGHAQPHHLTIHGKKTKKSGHQHLRQTKISWPNAEQQSRRGTHRSHRQGQRTGEGKGHLEPELAEQQSDGVYEDLQETARDLETKAKRKRKNRRQMQNTYINQHNEQKITSGRLRRIIRIDIHDDNFHSALSPEEIEVEPSRTIPVKRKRMANVIARLARGHKQPDTDDFCHDEEHAPRSRVGKISLDSDMALLPPGINLGSDGYIGKGRLFELLSFLKGDVEVPKPPALMFPDIFINPDASTEELLATLARAFDMIYDVSTMREGDDEYARAKQNAERCMNTICLLVTYRLLHDEKDVIDVLVATVSEQLHHLITRKEQSLELVSADGFSLDAYAFALYWFALEMRLRITYALKRSGKEVTSASHFATEQEVVRLLCRLLEYGFERTVGELQKESEQTRNPSNVHIVECWICIFYVSPFVPSASPEKVLRPVPPLWKYVEMALERQSNVVDARLFQSERIWRTVFGLCTLSQFSPEGISTSTARLEPYWPIIKKALQCIRLVADPKFDSDKPISALMQRDAYVRFVTARCLLLVDRWNWRLQGAEEVLRELCNIFRSRSFSNLLGEINDFPLFIREKDETRIFEYESADSAYSLFLKLTIRAANEFRDAHNAHRRQGAKLIRLLSLVVPVGSLSFTKEDPPVDQALSMLYNRYSAIFVAIYVNPSEARSHIQQACRYIDFRKADADSRTAAIRGMMYVAILLRHLNQPLDDVLQWVSKMIDDLSAELQEVGEFEEERGETLLMLQLVIGTLRSIIDTPCLKGRVDGLAKYPDVSLIQVWMSRLLSLPLGKVPKDHRTGEEMCKCIQAFLNAREAVFPRAPSIKVLFNREAEESQEDYGNLDLDWDDPVVVGLLDNPSQGSVPDNNRDLDQRASEILDSFSQGTYACLYLHIRCKVLPGGPYCEADSWVKAWIGLGGVMIRYRKRQWSYYFQLAESAWKDISDISRRTHVRQQFMISVLNADPAVYKTNQPQILVIWFEALVAPQVTVQPDFTALLFNTDGLRHALLRQMPCQPDETSGYNFDRSQFGFLRLQFVRQIFANMSMYLDLQQGEEYLVFLQTLLASIKSFTEAINNGTRHALEYATFRNGFCSQLRTYQTLLQYPPAQSFLSWADTL